MKRLNKLESLTPIGVALNRYLIANDICVKEIAGAAGINPYLMSSWSHNNKHRPNFTNLQRLYKACPDVYNLIISADYTQYDLVQPKDTAHKLFEKDNFDELNAFGVLLRDYAKQQNLSMYDIALKTNLCVWTIAARCKKNYRLMHVNTCHEDLCTPSSFSKLGCS